VDGLRDAVVAVVRRGDRVLVIERGPRTPRSGYWAPLSGKVEPGETQSAALVREVHEEVGLTVTAGAKVWESVTDDGRFLLHWWTAFETAEGEVVPDPGEVSAVRWVTPSEFRALHPVFDQDLVFFDTVLPTLRSAPPVA
jgi:8-oxo-dGTP diphosphatase